ncbi:hypothetical protein [Streptomyces sp. NPDC127036]|uniref:hypothetical protein n=1 Tax=Streptomyces sp. NPDC127036 TaxID=3347112 RepID=UPI0036586C4E
MTDRTDKPRVPDHTEQVTMVRTEPRPDGSAVLVVLTVGPPLTLIEHRMEMDPYLTRALFHTLARDLEGIPTPPPTREAVALLDAFRAGDREAFSAAVDGYSDSILNLWMDKGATA